jgi:hypothetical protein
VKASKAEYFASLSAELESQQRRIRHLIGSAHWGHDGRHKELLLAEVIRRHCPSSVLVSTGFVVSPSNFEIRSSEQDILLVDTAKEAPLFNQGGLVIAFPETVLAAISVKTTMETTTVDSVISGLKSVRDTAFNAGTNPEKTWCAGFFYTVDKAWHSNTTLIYDNVKRAMLGNPSPQPIIDDGRPYITGPNFLGASNDVSLLVDYERNKTKHAVTLRGYNSGQLATAVFLGCLLEHVSLHFDRHPAVFSDLVTELSVPPLDPPSMIVAD